MEVYSWEHHLFLWAISHGYVSHNQRVIQISALSPCPGDRTQESYGSIAEGRTSQLRCHSSPCARARQVGSWKIASGPGDSTPSAINQTYSCIGCWKTNPFLVGHWGRFMFFLHHLEKTRPQEWSMGQFVTWTAKAPCDVSSSIAVDPPTNKSNMIE